MATQLKHDAIALLDPARSHMVTCLYIVDLGLRYTCYIVKLNIDQSFVESVTFVCFKTKMQCTQDYFVQIHNPLNPSLKDCIEWVNKHGGTDYKSADEMGDCIGYCNILHLCFTEFVDSKHINRSGSNEGIWNNINVIQRTFKFLKIRLHHFRSETSHSKKKKPNTKVFLPLNIPKNIDLEKVASKDKSTNEKVLW